MNLKFSFLIITSILFLGCNRSTKPSTEPAPAKTKNIILMIGDGMGLAQISTVYYFSETKPNFSRFNYIGLHQNAPVGKKITDSAAGATAFSTGYKSYNAAIGVDKDTIPRETILEWAAKKGKSTGLLSTSSITHATPASFYAHVPDRGYHEAIAADYVKSSVDFAAGGGYRYFNKRTDGEDLLQKLEKKGVVVDTSDFRAVHQPKNRYLYLLGPDSLVSMQNGRGDFLPNASQIALDYLSNDKDGFFLMIEGSQIDWGGHYNDAQYVLEEMKDFDKTLGLVLDFAEKDGNTLVIVTADHETGGLALSAAEVRMQRLYEHIKPTFSTKGHTASLVPVFAYGPGADQFIGIYENNTIFDKMKAAFLK